MGGHILYGRTVGVHFTLSVSYVQVFGYVMGIRSDSSLQGDDELILPNHLTSSSISHEVNQLMSYLISCSMYTYMYIYIIFPQ